MKTSPADLRFILQSEQFTTVIISFLLVYLSHFSAFGQFESIKITPQKTYGPYENTRSFFSHQKHYIPGEPLNQTVKTIYIAINIWQKDDGTGNFTESDELHEHLLELTERLNMHFRSTPPPSHPVKGIDYLRDSHIRFELKDVGFYQNTDLYEVGCFDGNRLNEAVFAISPEKRKFLNIHFTPGNCRGASGYANYPSSGSSGADSFVVSFVKHDRDDLESVQWWALMLHVAHELGHNLELRHPYNSEYCQTSHPDFLFDLFGFEKQEWCHNPRPGCEICYHDGSWGCDLKDPETTCTNNIMGGNRAAGNITPLQMGRMNRAIANKSVRKYAWGFSLVPYEVSFDQTWDTDIKFYQDIIIKTGYTLHLTGTIEMVPEASLIVESGARLIVDGGRITNALYSETHWKGVVQEPAIKKGFLFWRKDVPEGEMIITNNGKVENYFR
ncbi:MAG: zinc-dependent metalloprotease [Bacteroidales bacterium]|nr:zinc-dependent metalloprotease [Bacteroidales bacterium]